MTTNEAIQPAGAGRELSEVMEARPSWRGAAGAWREEVRQRTGSERTPHEYELHVRRFLSDASLAANPARATAAHVHSFAYAPGPSGRTPSPSTVTVRLAAIRSFFDFARRVGLVEKNPADDVKRPRAPQPVPRGLSVEEFKRLLVAIPRTVVGVRDRAIAVTMVFTGLRRSEVMGLTAGDLTRNGHVYYTVRTKGGKVRTREMPPPAFAEIVRALKVEERPLDGLAREDRLFRVSAHGFYLNLRRYARKVDLENVSPHVLRHSAAKWRRETGASLEEVSGFLGHANLATTARYLARLEGEEDRGWSGVAKALGLKA